MWVECTANNIPLYKHTFTHRHTNTHIYIYNLNIAIHTYERPENKPKIHDAIKPAMKLNTFHRVNVK